MTPFIVAEMSANHLGSLERAKRIIFKASDAGADAVKFQTWSPDSMCIDPLYKLSKGPWAGRVLMDLYREAWTPWEWHEELFDLVRAYGMVPFSAAFDRESVDFLETLGVDRHKVASFELTDLPLIRYMASKGKPMILSTGMATEDEVEKAYWQTGGCPVTLLKCTSAYPSDASEANLATFSHLRNVGSSVEGVGLSDHTQGIGVAVAATAWGATMIEKHLTLSRADGGLDAGFSMEPHEFKQMVTECRRAAAAIGEVKYGPGPNEDTSLRRSWWVTRDMVRGDFVVTPEISTQIGLQSGLEVNVRTARPALGLSPSVDLRGAIVNQFIKAGTPLTREMLV